MGATEKRRDSENAEFPISAGVSRFTLVIITGLLYSYFYPFLLVFHELLLQCSKSILKCSK